MEDRSKQSTFALLILIATEIMFFAGLLSAYWVLRSQVQPWPPIGQPRYPAGVTALNTLILLASGWAFWQAEKKIALPGRKFLLWLGWAGLGGAAFLMIQGYEWFRLIQFGLGAASNVYGGIFYLIVGSHAFHVLIALGVFAFIFHRGLQGKYTAGHHAGLSMGRIYWLFVVLLWPLIYVALYLI